MARTTLIAGLIVLAFLSACSRRSAIVVGSKNFTEQVILGEIIAQHLETQLGRPVERRSNLGGTLLAHEALRSGQIDLYPEYTGTALTAILKLPPENDASHVMETVRSEYRKRWRLEWLDPLGFNNTFAMTIRGGDARGGQIENLSDAARRPAPWRLGAGFEFLQRADGLAGLVQTYHLRFAGSPKSMDLGLLYSALQQGQVDMIAASSTDGMLSVLDVRVLRDDKAYFPPYQCAIVARREALDSDPKLDRALRQLSGKLTEETMRKLNYESDGRHQAVSEIARAFLKSL
jgi:glycine betaine/choline ABC-type transport system substrate-binding protein